METQNQLFSLMQLAGGTFPSGGFSQSWGLETYVSEGRITDGDTFSDFLRVYLDSTVSRCEGPILCRAFQLAESWDMEQIMELEELSCAVKTTKESREAGLRMGKAFLRIMADILEDEELAALKRHSGGRGISYPVIYGLVCGKLKFQLEASLQAFVFSTANALVQSAVKLIPLGNTQAQKVLLDVYRDMEDAVQDSLKRPIEDISNFCPGLDIAGIKHETLPVRLYMS